MTTHYKVTVSFELDDGRELQCRYLYSYTQGNISGPPEDCYEDESDVGEPEYFLEGKYIKEEDLPTGLGEIADAMYENGEDDSRFSYRQEVDDPY